MKTPSDLNKAARTAMVEAFGDYVAKIAREGRTKALLRRARASKARPIHAADRASLELAGVRRQSVLSHLPLPPLQMRQST